MRILAPLARAGVEIDAVTAEIGQINKIRFYNRPPTRARICSRHSGPPSCPVRRDSHARRMFTLPTLAEIEAAAALVQPVVPATPQFTWPLLNARADCELWVKHE